MDIVELVALRKIEEAIERGEFSSLASRGWINYTVHGEAFFTWWWREKIARDETQKTD